MTDSIPFASVRPLQSLDLLSRREMASLAAVDQEVYRLFRQCALAVLNTGSDSDDAREIYESAKGGGHWMDFSRLSQEHLQIPLEGVAGVFFVLCLAPPLLAFLGNHYHAACARFIGRLREV